jgi:hypothetical protein
VRPYVEKTPYKKGLVEKQKKKGLVEWFKV